ncbi:MAG: glycerophosphodiester phosphodiesterase family protein [Halanaerobiales bacterium]
MSGKKPLIIGHRGTMGTEAENTDASFQKAVDMGADGVEFDVHLTSDRVPVVIHDECLDRTTEGTGKIKNKKLRDLEEYDILTLGETLDIVRNCKIINIEIKNGPVFYPGIEEVVIDIVKNRDLSGKVILSSFNHYTIKKIKDLDPALNCGLLYMAGLFRPWEYARMLGAKSIHPYHLSITPEIISQCQNNDLQVTLFGANKEKMIKRAAKSGADMLITDYPEKALNLLDK